MCCAVSFKARKQSQKCCQNRFYKVAETAIHTEAKQSQTKSKISYYLLRRHKPAHSSIIYTSQQFKQIPATTFIILVTQLIKGVIVNCIQQPLEQKVLQLHDL